MKCKQPHPGLELCSPNPFPSMMSNTTNVNDSCSSVVKAAGMDDKTSPRKEGVWFSLTCKVHLVLEMELVIHLGGSCLCSTYE